MGGPDAAFSMEPDEFKSMVGAVRDVEKALGNVNYDLTEKTTKSRDFSRSLFVVQDIKAGESLTEENVRSIRPGFGLHPRHFRQIIGKKVRTDIKRGTPLDWTLVE